MGAEPVEAPFDELKARYMETSLNSVLRSRLSLLGILLAGAALRVCRLGADSLWYDETVSTYLAGSRLPELLRHTAGDIHPPGYYTLLRGWLILMGYPTGRADPNGSGLEFAAGFFSLFFGVLLIALVYALARRAANRPVALIAAGLVAFSPYNVRYSQEARMYTLAAALGVIVLYALLRAGQRAEGRGQRSEGRGQGAGWWVVYAGAAAAGMYTLYYFVFLLIPLNLWMLFTILRRRSHLPASGFRSWLLANLAAALFYAPWIPVAFRQATNPPVPPWRTAPALWPALRESWTALSLGQAAPAWLWPAAILALALYGLGLVYLAADAKRKTHAIPPGASPAVGHPPSAAIYLPLATFGPLALILLISAVTPLYHVRYLFTYSPAFYIVIAAGLAWLLGRSEAGLVPTCQAPARMPGTSGQKGLRGSVAVSGAACVVAVGIWLAAAGVTLHAFWTDPAHRGDDHRAAVRFLREQWRPGDVVLVDAGWAYTALATYWDGPIASRTRLTDEPPAAPDNPDALVMVTTGHVDGDPGLGWGDPRSDFFAMPAEAGRRQLAALFGKFNRVWLYRIYDTVNDPAGKVRMWLDEDGRAAEDRVFPGEANLRVQAYLPRQGTATARSRPAAAFGPDLRLRVGRLPVEVTGGETVYPVLDWQTTGPIDDFATSIRLVGPDGAVWAQPPDERPAGPLLPASRWPAGETIRQTLALPVPEGAPPGRYTAELVVYDPATGQPWPAQAGELALTPNGLLLGEVAVVRPQATPPPQAALARFGPLALVEASSPATTVAAGGQVPVELLWQAAEAPAEPLVVVIQLQDAGGRVVVGLEAQPLDGRYPTQEWAAGERVRDRHTLSLPAGLAPGTYRLIVGAYRAADRARLLTRPGLFGESDHWTVKELEVKPPDAAAGGS